MRLRCMPLGNAASNKLPSCYVEDEAQWLTGLFVWGEHAQRNALGTP
jgi:hypothetical protein